jgi:preprotein translocase subunit YajC
MPNELILIILGCLVCGVFMMIGDWRRKKQDQRQARLNSIKFKNSQS